MVYWLITQNISMLILDTNDNKVNVIYRTFFLIYINSCHFPLADLSIFAIFAS